MWLLSTDRAELHLFGRPEDVPGGYAILSHVWAEDEQSFADVQELRSACIDSNAVDPDDERIPRPRFSSTPRDHVSDKIRQSCIHAESLGYKWLWNDTCCIDRSNDAELSEAVNVMYRYYSLSAICLAYLADVSPGDPIDEVEFRNSRWHTRGWTLPELIAPHIVKFVARDWTDLGSKHALAPLLESITDIPAPLLRGSRELVRFSVAQRMSWAKGRQTTLVEDRAYSLIGIFGIRMVIIYGEGHRAFERLQEKIVKRTADASIFVWGRHLPWQSFCDVIQTERHHHHDHSVSDLHLLARSPDPFEEARATVLTTSCSSVTGSSELDLTVALRVPERGGVARSPSKVSIPTYYLTQYGVLCHAPVFAAPSFFVALLFCSDAEDYLGAVLTPCSDSLDLARPTYHIGWTGASQGSEYRTIRVLNLGRDLHALRFDGKAVVFAWREMVLIHPLPAQSKAPPRRVGTKMLGPFRIAPTVSTMLMQYGWEACTRIQLPHPWADSPSVHTVFQCVSPEGARVLLAMGQCFQEEESLGSALDAPARQHWANVCTISPGVPECEVPPPHCCLEHHICDWPDLAKVFYAHGEGYSLPFMVAFAQLLANAGKTMVLNAVAFEGHTPPGLHWFSRATVCPSRQ
ncbi:HET-domain-containing protein [Ganoderma leucocontextum]|nr:HET-domain-containing protein [Ganoderma leucocontextum]